MAESRRRTLLHYKLPVTENLKLEFVTHKPWTGYNLYQGKYRSVVQVNTDLPIVINQAIDLGSHETYPGHHIFNILHERKLYQDKGLLEVSIYPLFSPETLIAEGTAEYGIELAFPGDEKIFFTKNVLLPLAGLDSSGITTYFKAVDILIKLNYTRNDAAKGIIDGTMSTKEAIAYLGGGDGPKQQIEFTKKFRSYVITYNYGTDIVKNYFERKLGTNSTTKERWDLYEKLLSDQVLIADLLEK